MGGSKWLQKWWATMQYRHKKNQHRYAKYYCYLKTGDVFIGLLDGMEDYENMLEDMFGGDDERIEFVNGYVDRNQVIAIRYDTGWRGL